MVRASVKALKKANGELTQEPSEIKLLLNKCFQDVFVIEEEGRLPFFEIN